MSLKNIGQPGFDSRDWFDSTLTQSGWFDQELVDAAVTAITGDAALTEAADTVGAAGVALIAGTAAITESADAVASVGVALIAGVSSISEAADSLSSSIAVAIVATAGSVEAADLTTGAAALLIQASASLAEDELESLSSSVAALLTGTASKTEDDDSLEASGGEPLAEILGDLDSIEADDALAADAIVATASSGGGILYPAWPKRRRPKPLAVIVVDASITEDDDIAVSEGMVRGRGRRAREEEYLRRLAA